MPAVVQQQGNYAATGSPLTVTLASAPAAGDVLVMIGAANHAGLTSVSGGGVATWTRAASSLSNANIELWFGVTNGSSSTVSIALTSNTHPIWMTVTEWSGLAATNTLDGASAAAGSTGAASAGSIATANARDLVLFVAADQNTGGFGTPGPASWTSLAGVGGGTIVQAEWYRITAMSGSVAPSVSDSGLSWDAAVAALRVAP